MIQVRRFSELGTFENFWLNAHYHFDFAGYRGAPRRHVGPLIVWNDDQIRAGTGFDPHPHSDMEIITYVRKGAITHQDNQGNEGRTEAGDVQVMSAGTGIWHAEYNREEVDTELFQIWLLPRQRGLQPRWDAMKFPQADRAGQLVALASGEADRKGALEIYQDATLYGTFLKSGQTIAHALRPGRVAYLVVAKGSATVNGATLGPRDGAIIEKEDAVRIAATEDSEVLLFDLPEVPQFQ
jgi:redox-sensitive bicupin YhaK (pirin superfamily)